MWCSFWWTRVSRAYIWMFPYLFWVNFSNLISFLTETEINTIKSLGTRFGNFTKYFQNENISQKTNELIFDVPHFLAKHKTLGYPSKEEGESVHHFINKKLRQYQSVRDEGEKLRFVITNKELLSTADGRLADVKPQPKYDSCKVYLRKGSCPQCHKKRLNNPS